MCIQTTTPNHVAASIGTSGIPGRSSRKVDDADIDALCASFKKLSLSDEPNDNTIRSFCASFEDLSLSDKPEDMEIDDPMDVDAIFGPLFDPPQDMKVDAFFPPLLKFGVQYMEIDAVFGPQLAPSHRD